MLLFCAGPRRLPRARQEGAREDAPRQGAGEARQVFSSRVFFATVFVEEDAVRLLSKNLATEKYCMHGSAIRP